MSSLPICLLVNTVVDLEEWAKLGNRKVDIPYKTIVLQFQSKNVHFSFDVDTQKRIFQLDAQHDSIKMKLIRCLMHRKIKKNVVTILPTTNSRPSSLNAAGISALISIMPTHTPFYKGHPSASFYL